MNDDEVQARAYGFSVRREADVVGVVLLDSGGIAAIDTFTSPLEARNAMRARYSAVRGQPLALRWVDHPMEDQDVRDLIQGRAALGEECWGLAFDGATILRLAMAVVADQFKLHMDTRSLRERFAPLLFKVERHLRDATAVHAGADPIDHPYAGNSSTEVGEALAVIRARGHAVPQEVENMIAAATAAMMVAMLNEQAAWSDALFLDAVDGALLARLEQIELRGPR